MTIDLILVPQGAEYKAVIRGIKALLTSSSTIPKVYALPIGPSVSNTLQQVFSETGDELDGKFVLLIGLGGSLSPHYQIGDVMLLHSMCKGTSKVKGHYNPEVKLDSTQTCQKWDISSPRIQHFYSELQTLTSAQTSREDQISPNIDIVQGVTMDRMVTTPDEKRELQRLYQADVVDMESAYVVDFLQSRGATVAVVRVISDNSDTDVPDLNMAIDSLGSLNFRKMLWQFLKQPVAAMRLIRGSLKGLKQLTRISSTCASIWGPPSDTN